MTFSRSHFYGKRVAKQHKVISLVDTKVGKFDDVMNVAAF